MKNKKKGFTLIELLAVIVILAIIALIATPIILNMINEARRSSAKSSVLGYIDAIEYNNGFAQIGQSGYTLISGINDVSDINVSAKGKTPESGVVSIDNTGKVTNSTLCINGYTVTYENKDVTDITKGCNNKYTAYTPGTLLYFDPVSNETCDSTHTTSSTCYKWRVITVDDTEDKSKITVQMDHNLVNLDRWSTGLDTTTGPDKILTALATATSTWTRVPLLNNYTYNTTTATNNYGTLTCTNGSCSITGKSEPIATNVKARLITGEEVKAISTEAESSPSWTLASGYSSGWFYVSSGTQKNGNTTQVNKVKWMFENTTENSGSGATNNSYSGGNNLGYWTLSPISDDSSFAWSVLPGGPLRYYNHVYNTGYCGARPVITMPKTVFS